MPAPILAHAASLSKGILTLHGEERLVGRGEGSGQIEVAWDSDKRQRSVSPIKRSTAASRLDS